MDPGQLIHAACAAFNARDIDTALDLMQPDVDWPNGLEGGSVRGRDAVRAYWTRQWGIIDPVVTPISHTMLADGRLSVLVHQVVRDLAGAVLRETTVEHVYRLAQGRIAAMEIRDSP
jgi:limonene-1,2-epoxide hydrolase